MPRYFFHLNDGEARPDREGTVLPDRNGAWDCAVKMMGQLLRDRGGTMRPSQKLVLTVAKNDKLICWRLTVGARGFVLDPPAAQD